MDDGQSNFSRVQSSYSRQSVRSVSNYSRRSIGSINLNRSILSAVFQAEKEEQKGPIKLPAIWCAITAFVTLIITIILIALIAKQMSVDLPKRYVIYASESTTTISTTTTTQLGSNSTTRVPSSSSESTISTLDPCPFSPNWIHFGFCDDESNVLACQFDNNDCCQDVIKADFCTDCICHEDNTVHQSIKIFDEIKCDSNSVADGICDDENNHQNCSFDGGDCCLGFVFADKCQHCTCHQDASVHEQVTVHCPSQFMIGDGICDDGCNTAALRYDGNDCCLDLIVDLHCILCQCLLELGEGAVIAYRQDGISNCMAELIGDGRCQDACNVQDFNYDVQDCCFDYIDSSTCQDCMCHLDHFRHPDLLECQDALIGDTECNDQCNNFDHDYDAGDCCTKTIVNFFCSHCFCHADGTRKPGECRDIHLGNGLCEDLCNDHRHKYDFGDCCLPYIDDTHCSDCICNIDESRHGSIFCHFEDIGNGICNDECNLKAHGYDSFDCCLPIINDYFCISCICHLNKKRHPAGCTTEMMIDHFCDDACASAEYTFDNGACCDDFINDEFCTECLCQWDFPPSRHPSHAPNTCHYDFLGDGICHDFCNRLLNNFDFGDCCLENIMDFHCTDCLCHLDGTRHLPACQAFMIGDGICNDGCNWEVYENDGLDCCSSIIIEESSDCQCLCHADGTKHDSGPPMNACLPTYIGDGQCDDVCNNEVNNFDNQDCCLNGTIDDAFCQDCFCITNQTRFPSMHCPPRIHGDGSCDDACNSQDYDFDLGDCCLEPVMTNFCIECECKENNAVTTQLENVTSSSTAS